MKGLDSALVEVFFAEGAENLVAMEQGLLALESGGYDDEQLHVVFRAAHTLKGNASSLGLARVAELAHALEDLLERLRAGTLEPSSSLVTLLLEAVDALRDMLQAGKAGQEKPRRTHGQLINRLKALAVVQGLETSGKPAAPAGDRRRNPGRRFSDQIGLDPDGRTLRVALGKLDRLLDLSGELAIARARLQAALEAGTSPETRRARDVYHEADQLFADLQELVMDVRMVPVGPLFRHFGRTVRDQSAALGKQVRLLHEGEDVEVDARIIEHLRDPLTHMIRNALDHGIEPPAQRATQGKDPVGTITLRARHETGSVVFEVCDDGAGIDTARILQQARERGLLSDHETLSEGQAHALVLEAGFSTARQVTNLSGRGIGLDIVRRHVETLRGTLSIASRPGVGATITARVPLTLAIIPGFGVGVADQTFVVPMERVVETLELPEDDARAATGCGVVMLREEPLPYVRLRDLFDLGQGAEAPPKEQVVVVRDGDRRVGLAVDVLHGENETVVKPLGRLFQKVAGIAGSAILGTGRVALIVDVPALLKQAELVSAEQPGNSGRPGAS